MKRIVAVLAGLAVVAAAIAFYLSRAVPLADAEAPSGYVANLENGKLLFTVGGCLACHGPAKGDKDADRSLPSGGFALKTPIGTFYPPNLTPDRETGIGEWDDARFLNAFKKGVRADGQHYLPAFPYTSYAHMRIGDILDIKAYLMSLKAVRAPGREADIPLMWFVRRGMGLWKLVAFDERQFKPDPSRSKSWNRGAYLVAGPGHCSECHTPRNIFMMPKMDKYLAGGPHPEGKGKVPSLRDLVGRKRYKDADDLVTAFQFGEAFGYDKMSSGGMGEVRSNLSKLPESDLKAIAEYLVSLK